MKAETPVVMASSSQNVTIVPQSVVVEKESVSQPVQPHQSVSAYTPQSLAQNANPLPPMEKTSSVYGLPIRRVTQTKHLSLKRPYLRNHFIYERISLLFVQRRTSAFIKECKQEYASFRYRDILIWRQTYDFPLFKSSKGIVVYFPGGCSNPSVTIRDDRSSVFLSKSNHSSVESFDVLEELLRKEGSCFQV